MPEAATTEEAEDAVGKRDRLLILLGSLVFILLVVPMFEYWTVGRVLLRLGITCVLISAAVATARRRALIICAVIIAGIAIHMLWLTMLFEHPSLLIVGCVLDSVFFAAVAVLITSSVLNKHLATIQSIYGAICAYLLLGLAWAMLYWGIAVSVPDSFSIPPRRGAEESEVTAFSDMVYFSFVTMSTLGYGDVLPTSALARTLTWMQSVTGLFYVAVVVAWLVSEIPSRRRNDE